MLLLLSFVLPATAQDVAFQGTKETKELEVPEAKTTLAAELGGLWTTGNAQLYAVNGGITFESRWKRNRISALAGTNLGAAVPDVDGNGFLDDTERESGYRENARRVFGEARYDRFLSEKDSLYVLAGGFHDIFAGFDLRTHEQIGYSRVLLDRRKKDGDKEKLVTLMRAEIGFDYAQEWRTSEEDPFANVLAGRLLFGLSHQFNDNVGVTETFELYENVIDPVDLRILNTAAVTATLTSKLSLKVSHTLIFDNQPVPNFRKFDQTTGVTLVATLL